MIDEKKLIERLEKISVSRDNDGVINGCNMGICEDDDCLKCLKKKIISIVNQLAEENKTCYKSCTECEAYDKEKHYCPKFCEVLKEAAKELAEEFNNGWIPCSERLPKNFEVVLFSTKEGMVEAGWYDAKKDWCVCDSYSSNAFEFIAWQPLPAPFKPKGE